MEQKTTCRIAVCDDEPLGRTILIRMIQSLGHECVGEATNGIEAIDLVKRLNPDILLLDVRMPEMDGIRCATELSKLESPPAIIFISAFDQHAIDAFKTEAVGYILKPVNEDDLRMAIQRAKRLSSLQTEKIDKLNQKQPQMRSHLAARTHRGIELIHLDNIYFFMADQKYVTVRHTKGEVLIDETLKELEQEFSDRFMRIHRNALMSLSYLEGLEMVANGQYQVKLKGIEDRLLVSRRHLSELRERMAKL